MGGEFSSGGADGDENRFQPESGWLHEDTRMIGADYHAVSQLEQAAKARVAQALKETDAGSTDVPRDDVTSKFYTEAGRLVLKRTQDVEPYLEANQRAQNAISSKSWSRVGKRAMRVVAEIPNIVVEQWLREGFNIFRCSANELRSKIDSYGKRNKLKVVPWKLGQRTRHI